MYTDAMNTDQELGPKKGYLAAGRFAQAAQLSRKALRLYDQLGILVPEYVDPKPAIVITARPSMKRPA